MANYQIKLTPVEGYFFGGEKHIENEKGELRTNYFVESNLYPQQTTLLGLLRYFLLTQNLSVFNMGKILDKPNAAKLIGESSFDFGNSSLTYGKIASISPMYLNDGTDNYFFAPLDFVCTLENGILKVGEKHYNAKNYSDFIRTQVINNQGKTVSLTEIIADLPQVGNEKTVNQQEKENAFYKQNMKTLQKGWSFCVDAEIEIDIEETTVFIPFGGEKCIFQLHIKSATKFQPQLSPTYQRGFRTIVCLSDCFLDKPKYLLKTCFAINKNIGFRNIQSKVATTERYSALSQKDDNQLKRGKRYNLLQRGSVLYFDSEVAFNEVKNTIEAQTHCQKIGFNHILAF